MIKAAIFDMDGLLINSEPLWDEVDREILRERGYKLSEDIRLQRIGIGQQATVALLKKTYHLPDTNDSLLVERQRRFTQLYNKNPQLMPGAKQIILLLHAKKVLLGIATGGHNEERVKEMLQHFGLAKYFHSITTSHEVVHNKPAPDIFLLEAKKLDIDPAYCLVLEDAPSGVEAGKNAGMKGIGVIADNVSQKRLKEKGADRVFSSLEDIDEHIIEELS